MRTVGLLAMLVMLTGISAWAKTQAQAVRYRDVQVYTTSRSDAKNPARIIVRTQFVNRGRRRLKVSATLHPNAGAGFAGAAFTATIAPGKDALWSWDCTPPDGLRREMLTGEIALDGQRDRELYIAMQGTDPAEYYDQGAERITERARVVATYAPRTRERIQSLLQIASKRPKAILTLAEKGHSDYAILIPDLPAIPAGKDPLTFWKEKDVLTLPQREFMEAIEDLQRCLKLQSAAVLPVVARPVNGKHAIRIALNPKFRKQAGVMDAYRLRTHGTDIRIESDSLDGLRNGVYGLLTDHLDCHWFQPRQLGEEIMLPADQTVRLPALDETRGSAWFSCTGASWANAPRWDRQNRCVINRGRMSFGHSWYGYINANKYPYDKFPEYYARDRQGAIRKFDVGWSSTNFCTTNPEVIEIVAKQVNGFFAVHPDAVVCSLDPNDLAPMCRCERCLALDVQYGQTAEDGNEVADRLLHFSKEIYQRLDQKYKEKYLGILIYGHQMELPKGAKPHDHHAGMICDFPPRYDFSRPWNDPTSAKNREFHRLMTGWGSMLKQIGYYEYYNHYAYFGPFGVIHKMREELPAFHELGGTFLMLESDPNFGAQGLNNYLAARLVWDVNTDIDVAMEEFIVKYYGPAAEPMRKYWLAAERHFALERPGTRTDQRVAVRPEFWAELDAHLHEAERSVANLPAAQKRFIDRVTLNRLGFDYGRLYSMYQAKYAWLPRENRVLPSRAQPYAADALQFLRDNRRQIETLQQHHPTDDPYWPALVAAYSYLNLDEEIARLEKLAELK